MYPEVSVLNQEGSMIMELFQRYHNTEDPIEKSGYLALAEKKAHSKKVEKAFLAGNRADLENLLRTLPWCKADANSLFADLSAYLEKVIPEQIPLSWQPVANGEQLKVIRIERRLTTKATLLSEISGNSIENIHKLFEQGVVQSWLKEIYLPQAQKVVDQITPCKNVKTALSMSQIRKHTSSICIAFSISVETMLDDDQTWLDYVLKVNRRISEKFSDKKIFF